MNKILNIVALITFALAFNGCYINRGEETTDSIIGTNIISSAPINITSPTSYDRWELGSEQRITWQSPITVKKVRIELYRKNSLQRVIISETENNNSYVWILPTDLSLSLNYLVRVINLENEDQYGNSERFTIKN